MRKNIIAFIAIVIVSMSLTACGNNTASANTTEYSNTGSQNQTSNTEVEPTENPANVDNSGHEPDSYQSGNFQDYWEGDDFFDIEAFAKANGMPYVSWRDISDNITEDSSLMHHCSLFNDQTGWKVIVYDKYCLVENYNMHVSYQIMHAESTEFVSVSSNNNVMISTLVIQDLPTILDYLNANSDSTDPLAGSGL